MASARAPLNRDAARFPARAPRDAARFPAHCLEDACRLVTLASGVLAVVANGRLTLESGVLAVDANGRLAPLVAVTDFNFPLYCTVQLSRPPAIVAQCYIRGDGRPPNFLA